MPGGNEILYRIEEGGREMSDWKEIDNGYDGMHIGYWYDGPVIAVDGTGVAKVPEGKAVEYSKPGGSYIAYVEDGKWHTVHKTMLASEFPLADLNYEGDNELAEISGLDVGWT